MENNTISYLRSKMWYRFLKVAYLFLFIASILVANGVIISDGIGRTDNNKTLIYCNGGDKRIITSKQAGVDFGRKDFIGGFDYKKFYEGYYNEYKIRTILEGCYDEVPDDDIFTMQRFYEIAGFKANRKQYDENYLKNQLNEMRSNYKSNSQKASYLDYSTKLFDIKPVYSYRDFLMYFFVANLSILAFFEIVRRIFYYIVLGSIKPHK